MRLGAGLLLVAASLLTVTRLPGARGAGGAEKDRFAREVAPLLAQYCTRCHGGARPKSGLALDVYRDEAAALKHPDVWERVAQILRAHDMPPPRRPQPSPAEVERITAWIDRVLGSGDCLGKKDPGQVTLRRLNRAEYNNTIRDLVGVPFQPADDFPADDVGYGFDNIGDVLSLPPLLLEKYLAAAEQIVGRALADPRTHKRIVPCRPEDFASEPPAVAREKCARTILEPFARRAYRRPVSAEEVDRLAGFIRLAQAQGDSFDKGIELALQAVLTSPHFLFRVEREPRKKFGGPQPVSAYELASRLSYFLWSSMPDEELFEQARRGTLPRNLEAQVRRLLHDPKAKALAENFAGQWLQLRNLNNANPNPAQFPAWDEPLRAAMRGEAEHFFAAVVREDRSVLDFLDADFTFVNERLARHYGIPGVQGDQLRRVALAGGPRGGVVTMASVLTVTSNPTRTSPVKRGKWILENILGTPPPPPPPDAGPLSETSQAVLSGSLRQRMEQHRARPNCAVCHQRMDALGFGLENFDAIGAWRPRDGSFPIDATGTLPDGRTFHGPAGLKAILRGQREAFARCLTEKLLTYALGRGLEAYDRCAVDQITGTLARNDYKFSNLVLGIVRSDPFQMRRGRVK